MADLLSVQEALDRMLKRFLPVPKVSVPLELAFNMVLAEDIISSIDQPSFTNSSMDGFAVIASDTIDANPAQPVHLQVVMDIPAGNAPKGEILPGQAARIMTGAALPDGADTVVPVEDTDAPRYPVASPPPARIGILYPVRAGSSIRPRGQDLKSGDLVLKAGRRLRPQDLGMLSSLGNNCIPVFRRPKIALMSSGDELISPSEPLLPGKIRDSNSIMLGALIEQAGVELIRLGITRDEPDQILKRLQIAIDRSVDLIVTSAGISVGAFDYIRDIIERNGNLTFWKVNMRPGKPLAYGSFRGIPFIGLPGNPVSAYVGFQVFVKPVLHILAGEVDFHRPTLKVTLEQLVESDGRESFLRAILVEKCGKITATLAGHQGSGNLFSLIKANALIIIPAGVNSLTVGSEVDAWLLDENWLSS